MHVENAVLPNKKLTERFNVEFKHNKIESVTEFSDTPKSNPSLLLPALCHPHIHLDKAFILTSHGQLCFQDDLPDYSDLGLESGGFKEALSKTGQAKSRYTEPDLSVRGAQLIAESIQAGVTSMRAFVEVDHVTQFKCIESAIKLQFAFNKMCHIQLCAFAQDPIMSTEHGEENRKLMEKALDVYQEHIQVLGSTPYVEEDNSHGVENIKWAIKTAIQRKLHLDFHLDFSDNSESQPLIWDAIRLLKEENWIQNAPGLKVLFGHCTRMALFSKEEMERLTSEIADLPVSFVGLPTSDLFMMGRPTEDQQTPGRRERGTLQILDMIQENGLQACIGVNNAGNAFTPWGSIDPLRVASLGVGVYHGGTTEQARILYECVSTRARRAIGLQEPKGETEGGRGKDDFDLLDIDGGGVLVIDNEKYIQYPGLTASEKSRGIPARPKLTIADVVWDPPELRLRRVIGNAGKTFDDDGRCVCM